MERGADLAEAGSPHELRRALADLGVRVLDAQPAMAPLVALLGDVLGALTGARDVAAARAAAKEAARSFREGLAARARSLAERTAALLPAEGVVLTLSSSAAVREALLRGASSRGLRVVILESRPLLEGQGLAAELAEAGLPVTVAVDAAAEALVPDSDLLLLGADSVGDLGVVNKLGSRGAARAARAAGVPVVVSTDTTKILPPGFPQLVADDRPGAEVMPPRPGVAVWNRYFEAVPLGDVTWVVTEAAALDAASLERFRAGVTIPEEAWAWAARIGSAGVG
jgi:translation initiation factor 2B subunit (eIF-2B alpha/beta/delta family)